MSSPGTSTGRDPRQSLPAFSASPRLLRLVPLAPEPLDDELLEWLGAALSARIPAPVLIDPVLPAAPEWYTPERSQLASNRIIDALVQRFPAPAEGIFVEWTLGLTAADLRGGSRDFVFGEAARGGNWAVVSTARFGVPGKSDFKVRLLKEALHELGHLTGLGHCRQPDCLMFASPDLASVDAKEAELCQSCRSYPHGG